MKVLKFFIALLFISAFAGKLMAQDADEIVTKYIKAMGGIENMRALNTMKMTGKFSGGGMEVPFVQTYKRPLMVMTEASIQGMTMKQAFDGKQGWMINPFMGKKDADLMSKDMEKTFRRNADFEGQLVNYKEKGSSIELIGKEDFEGTPVYNIKLTDSTSDVTNYFIDADSFLMIKQIDKIKFDTKEVTAETIVSNYKKVGGIMIPFTLEIKSPDNPQGPQTLTIENVEVNIPIEDSFFKMPEPGK